VCFDEVPDMTDTDPSSPEEKLRHLLGIYPTRNPVRWKLREGRVVVSYRKSFGPLESFLHRKLGGPRSISRPLDELGSRMWLLCDGRHSLAEIIGIMSAEYHEKIEPAHERVWAFMEILLNTGLLRLESGPRGRLPLRVGKR